MGLSSIQVTSRMRARLAKYKLPGMSYEDVLAALLEAVPREEFIRRQRRAQAEAREALRAPTPGRRPDAIAERVDPGDGMEQAFRLFQLMRVRT